MADIGEVIVAAPAQQQSAMSHSITMYHPIWVTPHAFANPNVMGWRIGGTPADSVKIALEALLDAPPDIIISGINKGPNLGTDVLYSGTVSAALEGALHRIPAIAVSLTSDDGGDYGPAARFTQKLAVKVLKEGLPDYTLLNVNVPPLSESEIKGVSITKLGIMEYDNAFQKRTDPRGRVYYWMAGNLVSTKNDPDTDVVAIDEQRISVTPVKFDLTDCSMLKTIQDWNL